MEKYLLDNNEMIKNEMVKIASNIKMKYFSTKKTNQEYVFILTDQYGNGILMWSYNYI